MPSLAPGVASAPGLAGRDGRPRRVWPWPGGADGLVAVTCGYGLHTGESAPGAAADDHLPPRIQRASTRRKAEYLAGRRCAGEALMLACGGSHPPSAHSDGSPHWPRGTSGSISHSDGLAIAVAGSGERCVGVDVERVLDAAATEEIAPLVLDDREGAVFGGLSRAVATTLSFSMKESLFKALYPAPLGLSPFDVARVVAWDTGGTAALELVRSLDAGWQQGRVFRLRWAVAQGYAFTLAGFGAPTLET